MNFITILIKSFQNTTTEDHRHFFQFDQTFFCISILTRFRKTLWFSDFFKGYRNRKLDLNWLIFSYWEIENFSTKISSLKKNFLISSENFWNKTLQGFVPYNYVFPIFLWLNFIRSTYLWTFATTNTKKSVCSFFWVWHEEKLKKLDIVTFWIIFV